MNNFKTRMLALLLALLMAAGIFAGCDGQEETVTEEVTEQIAEETTEEATEEPAQTEEPAGQVWKEDKPWTREQTWDTEQVQLTQLSDTQKLQKFRTDDTVVSEDYTLMVYIVGSNLESEGGCATDDLMEMLDAGLKPENCNLLVHTGGSTSWQTNIPSNCNAVWKLTAGGSELRPEAQTIENVNTGDPAVLADFLNYCTEQYPAEHYGLILWDHGGGPIFGYGHDELYDDLLSMAELDAALAATAFAEQRLDWIGFDACLMSTMEIGSVLAPYARYMLASQETEPGWGWDYSCLGALNNGGTEELLPRIMENYPKRYFLAFPDQTLAWIDLDKLPQVHTALDSLCNGLLKDIQDGKFYQIASARGRAKRFGVDGMDLSQSYDLVDMASVAEQFKTSHATEANALLTALDEVVVQQTSNVEEACGLSMYFPYDSKIIFLNMGADVYNTITTSRAQRNFMHAFTSVWIYGKLDTDWIKSQKVEEQDGKLELAVPQQCLADVGSVRYSLLEEDTDGSFEPVMYRTLLEAEDGTYTVPEDPEVVLAITDQGQEVLLPTVKQDEGRYRVTVTLTVSESYTNATQSVNIMLQQSDGELQIVDVVQVTEDMLGGKSQEDISNWGALMKPLLNRFETYDEEGLLKPFFDWNTNGWVGYSAYGYDEEIRFEKRKLSEVDGKFSCHLEVFDICGNPILSQLHPVPSHAEPEMVTEQTPKGTMTFRMYDDHAELWDYEGEDEQLTIPGTVNGKTVTKIRKYACGGSGALQELTIADGVRSIEIGAFSGCSKLSKVTLPDSLQVLGSSVFGSTDLEQIELPDSLTHIGQEAFRETPLKQIELPKSVIHVGSCAFAGCEKLQSISVEDGGNDVYQCKDGVLLSADGKTLYVCPAGVAKEAYQVPKGVQTIAAGAFAGLEKLAQVDLPEGLITIDDLAFYDTVALKQIELPATLERIGNMAFAASVYHYGDVVETIAVVRIGENVTYIGKSAFEDRKVERFEVADGNEEYSASENGCLLNAAGTKLLIVPAALTGKLVVPDGVSSIDKHAWSYNANITALVYPDSLTGEDEALPRLWDLTEITVGKGMMQWNNIEEYPCQVKVNVSAENPYYTVYEGSVYTADRKELVAYFGTEEIVKIPEGVEIIRPGALEFGMDENAIKELTLPASLTSLPAGELKALSLRTIAVEPGNTCYAVYDGLLYTADGTKLLYVPRERTQDVVVRDGTVEICEAAFGGFIDDFKYNRVELPEGVQIIGPENFYNATYYKGDGKFIICLPESLTDIYPNMFNSGVENIQVSCPAGSVAEAFAKEKGVEVIETN